jgi:tetratricopeptide (TPR) repeat protein
MVTSMTLRQICVLVACDTGRSYGEVRAVVDVLLETVKAGLASDRCVHLAPVGSLSVRRARVRFRASKGLRAEVADIRGPVGRDLAVVARSEGYADVGEWDEAVGVLEALLARHPGAAELHHQMATLYLRKGRSTRARDHLEAASTEGVAPEIQLAAADTWLGMSRYDKAELIYRRLTQDRSARRDALIGLASVHHKRGLYGEAASTLQKALQLDPDDADVLLHLGMAYHHLERYSDALQCLERAREGSPGNPRVYWYLGLLYDHTGRTQDAQAMYRRHKELQDGE